MKRPLIALIINMFLFSANFACAMGKEASSSEDSKTVSKAPTWKFLKEGDGVEIIAPSGAPLTPGHIEAIKSLIASHGLQPFLPEGAIDKEASRHGYFANSDENRTKYFIEALQGPSKALWALRGGFGAAEVVYEFELSAVSPPKHPKLIIGFSDITALHLLAATWGWPSLHGSVIGLGEELFKETQVNVNKSTKLSLVFSILKGEIRELEHTFNVIHSGSATLETPIFGSVMGGNLSIIENHKGTPTALQGKGRFIFLEDTSEDPKRLIRRLIGLVRAGVFDEAKGIIFGNNPIAGSADSSQTIDEIKYFIKNFLLPRNINIPVVYSPRFGHDEYNDVMPLGTTASLSIHEYAAILKVSVNESAYQ
ncbi:MAG: LD-carboxypeptidase [Alphaproteobacteria bacterium]|nr:LD-carboxypeptidase [Alphaproteobacteria bacterium]